MNSRPLYIVGAGGLGKEVASLVYAINRVQPTWHLAGYFDDDPGVATCAGLPVVGSTGDLAHWKEEIALVLALGNPLLKKSVKEKLRNSKITFPVLIDPNVSIGADVRIGNGTIICAGARLTTDIEVEEHVLINLNATVGHDTRIGSCTSIMPGVNIAGNVHIEEAVLIGSGANVLNGVCLHKGARVGSGAVVVGDVSENTTVVGIPAKVSRKDP